MKLSIITINLNNADGLKRTIESIVSQTFQNYEYIVIDGGSTDGSIDIIIQYSDKIAHWISEPDKGIYNAMNKGILRAKGEYCLFMNSGDYLISDAILEKVFSLNLDTDIFCSKTFGKQPDEITFCDLYRGSFMHQNMFIKTSLFDLVGLYDESYKIIADRIFNITALVKYNCTLSFYNFTIFKAQPGGISWTDGATMDQERERFMNEKFPYFHADYKEFSTYKYSEIIRLYNILKENKLILKIYSSINGIFRKLGKK